MGLQLRVRHSLGARIVEVDDGTPDRPVRIGRDPGAAVQVPSGVVLPLHCLLYQQEGKWVVQKADESADVAVNDEPIEQAAYLEFGDSITLGRGAGAATLELDPLGTARRASAPANAYGRPAAPVAGEGYPGAARAGSAPPPAAVSTDDSAADEDEQWNLEPAPAASAGAWSSSSQPAPYRRPPRAPKQSNQNTVVAVCVAFGVVFVLLAGLIFHQLNKRDEGPKAVMKQPDPRLPDLPQQANEKRQHGSIFDNFGEKQAKIVEKKGTLYSPTFGGKNPGSPQPQTPVRDPVTVAPDNGNGDAEAAAPAAATDPLMQTEEWQNIEQGLRQMEPVRVIWACHDFQGRHPGRLEQELQAKQAEALDLLWWQRLHGLCTRRKELQERIATLTKDISQEAPGSLFRQGLEKDKAAEEFRLEKLGEQITVDMAYASKVIPNYSDSAELDVLRRDRDADKFAKWSQAVVKSIQMRRVPPWER